jgi:hypothetical protein
MIDLYRFLAFIENLPEVNHVRDMERDGLRQSVWDSGITNKTARIDLSREEISVGIATEWLRLLGYDHMINTLTNKLKSLDKERDENKESVPSQKDQS